MKALVRGRWQAPVTDRAAYDRARAAQDPALFRDWVVPNEPSGDEPSGDGSSGFPAEAGRYHLYVSYACPFAHRAILYHRLFGLEEVVPMSVLHPRWATPEGWAFRPDPDFPEVTEDRANGLSLLWQLYVRAKPDYTGKVVVPVLWDSLRKTIVSTESAEIMRMFDQVFAPLAGSRETFYPDGLRAEIDDLAGLIRPGINGGVYAVGFAAGQAAYDRAIERLFGALDDLEARLADGRAFLLGARPTEADWLLYPTLVRFDAVYHGALRCNRKTLSDYPALSALAGRLHSWPGVAATTRLNHARRHYYDDLGLVDPTVVPAGPRGAFEDAA